MFSALLCIAAALAAADAYYTGDRSRMVGGDIVQDASRYSFQVAISVERSNTVSSVCSGILIGGATTNYILTSGSCATPANTFQVWAGTNRVLPATAPDARFSASAVNITFAGTFLNSNEQTDDLAIIQAPDAINNLIRASTNGTGTKPVTTATLVNINDVTNCYLSSSVTMAGWGYPNDVFNGASPSLRQVTSRVVPNSYCTVRHLGKPISRRHICTGGLINKGPCTGDSGAPLILSSSNRVIGIATLTPTAGCSQGKPGVFTRLGYYLAWIVRVTGYDPEQ